MLCCREFLVFLLITVSVNFASTNVNIIPSLNLPALVRDANLIVVGEVESVWEEGRTSISIQGHSVAVRRRGAKLRVDRVLKGQAVKSSITFRFLIPELPLGYKGIPTLQFGMFFLRENSPQEYVILDPYHPFIAASPDAPITPEDSNLNKVIADIAFILVTPRSSHDERLEAIQTLSTVETEEATMALRRAAEERDATLRLRAVAALLQRNDISVLRIAEDTLLHPSQDTNNQLLRNITFALDGVKDPQAIPSLQRLLSARDVLTRRGAARALRHTGVANAIEPLARALEDSDQEVRYSAVIGLAEITGQDEWGPSTDLFQANEQYFLNHWREWVRNR